MKYQQFMDGKWRVVCGKVTGTSFSPSGLQQSESTAIQYSNANVPKKIVKALDKMKEALDKMKEEAEADAATT